MMPHADRAFEVATKLQRLREQMAAREVDAVVLNQLPNIAWLTAGASTYINLASDTGPSSLLITLDSASVITDQIEAGRLSRKNLCLPWVLHWQLNLGISGARNYQGSSLESVARKMAQGKEST